jgi:dolichyl-phosphate-mannose-protein mannosyltransferase
VRRSGPQARSRLSQRTRPKPVRIPAWITGETGRQLRYAFFIFIAGLVLFSIRLDVPQVFSFDEPAYVPAANAFGTGVNLETSHPPLGKMILALGIQAFGDNPTGWRVGSVIAGAFILVLVYALTLLLSRDTIAAVAATAFTAVNGMLFTMARTATLDVPATMFLFAGLACVAAIVRGNLSQRWGGALAGCAFGLCMACKWMAPIPTAACCGLLWVARKRAAIAAMILPFAAAYAIPFAVLALILGETPSWSWFRTQQVQIFIGHAAYSGKSYNASHWWTWALKLWPVIPGWFNLADHSQILLLGNPVVMWLGVGALLVLAYRACRYRDGVAAALCAAYVVLYGQYAVMPLKAEYYYYYLAASLCLGPALALLTRSRPRLVAALTGLAAWSFVCEYPSMTGIPGGHWARIFF